MFDTIGKVQCPDCKSVVSYSFVLVASDGNKTAFMQLACCEMCRRRGDNRSLRNFADADRESIMFALSHKLPIVLLGG